MKETEAQAEIVKRTVLTNQTVTLAKAFLLSPDKTGKFLFGDLADQFATQQGYQRVGEVVLHPSVDVEPVLTRVAGNLACNIGLNKALWELIYTGDYMTYVAPRSEEPGQAWTTIVDRGGGQRSSWKFPEFEHVVPEQVMRSPFSRYVQSEGFSDPDLFVLEAGVGGADPEVQEALQVAVRCLRHELYRPALTMLGKAMEGAWIELGLALSSKLLKDSQGKKRGEKIQQQMRDDNRSIAKKISDVRNLYQDREVFAPIIKSSGVRPEELENAVVWSNVVREARNAIHFGVRPIIANSHEKAAVLSLDGATSLNAIYAVKAAATQADE